MQRDDSVHDDCIAGCIGTFCVLCCGMQLFCSRCQAAYAAASHCPRCGSRLLSPQESFLTQNKAKRVLTEPPVHGFGSRLMVGLLVTLGLVMSLREFTAAMMLLPAVESNLEPVCFAIRLFSIIAGSLVAGSGCRQGVRVGGAVGLCAAAIFTVADAMQAGMSGKFSSVFLSAVYPLMSFIAGAIGTWLWPPDADLPEPRRISSHGSSLARLAVEDAEKRSTRPICWVRIFVAAVLVLFGIMYTDPIRFALSKYSAGIFNTGGISRSASIGLQLSTLLVLMSGFIAGAGTGGGFKHGFLASLIASFGLLLASRLEPTGSFPTVFGYLQLFGIEPEPLLTPRIAVNFLIGLIGMMSIAAALGGQLFPPLAPRQYWKHSLQRQS